MPRPTGTTEHVMFILQPYMPLGHNMMPVRNTENQTGQSEVICEWLY